MLQRCFYCHKEKITVKVSYCGTVVLESDGEKNTGQRPWFDPGEG